MSFTADNETKQPTAPTPDRPTEEVARDNDAKYVFMSYKPPKEPDGDWAKLGWHEKPFKEWPDNMSGFSPVSLKTLKENYPDSKMRGFATVGFAVEDSTVRYSAHCVAFETPEGTQFIKHCSGSGGPHDFKMPSDEELDGVVWSSAYALMSDVMCFFSDKVIPLIQCTTEAA